MTSTRANKKVVRRNKCIYFTNTAKLSHTNNEQLIISKPPTLTTSQSAPMSQSLHRSAMYPCNVNGQRWHGRGKWCRRWVRWSLGLMDGSIDGSIHTLVETIPFCFLRQWDWPSSTQWVMIFERQLQGWIRPAYDVLSGGREGGSRAVERATPRDTGLFCLNRWRLEDVHDDVIPRYCQNKRRMT